MGGLFGGNDDEGEINSQIQAQIDAGHMKEQQDYQSIVTARLALIKNQGQEQWTADDTSLGNKALNSSLSSGKMMKGGGGFF